MRGKWNEKANAGGSSIAAAVKTVKSFPSHPIPFCSCLLTLFTLLQQLRFYLHTTAGEGTTHLSYLISHRSNIFRSTNLLP